MLLRVDQSNLIKQQNAVNILLYLKEHISCIEWAIITAHYSRRVVGRVFLHLKKHTKIQ